METTIISILGLYRDNGKENGNYTIVLGKSGMLLVGNRVD